MSVTIEQIAARVGVSSSTVARVLRGDVKGAQERSARKAEEIRKVSVELGYRPNWRARAFSRGKTHTIGLLYSNSKWIFEDPMNEIAVAFTEALQEHNYDLRLIPVTETSNWEELVYGSAVDGLVFLQHVPERTEAVVREKLLPLVLLNEKSGDAPHVATDDESGGYLATRHLLGLGHERIGFYIAEHIRAHVSVGERLAGYERAMREAGLGDQIIHWRCDADEVVERLFGPSPPTALICYCQVEALSITHAAWANGLAIPTGLSLVAFNDITMTECMTPPLTVVGFDTAEMGRAGAAMLVSCIEHPQADPPENVLLRQKLVVRGTTAPPTSRQPRPHGQ